MNKYRPFENVYVSELNGIYRALRCKRNRTPEEHRLFMLLQEEFELRFIPNRSEGEQHAKG